MNPRLKTHAGVMVSQSERRSGAFALLEAYRRANVEACAFLRAFALLDAR